MIDSDKKSTQNNYYFQTIENWISALLKQFAASLRLAYPQHSNNSISEALNNLPMNNGCRGIELFIFYHPWPGNL